MPKKKKPDHPKKSDKSKAEPKWTTNQAADHLFPKPLIDKVRQDLDSPRSGGHLPMEEE